MDGFKNLFADEDFVVEHLFASPENAALIDTFSAVELSNFAVNDAYRKNRSRHAP